MKKIKTGLKNKGGNTKVKIHHKGLDRALAIPLIILVAIGGVITLKFSLADSNIYGIMILMHDNVTGKNIPGIKMTFSPYNTLGVSCTYMDATTDNTGTAAIYGCPATLGYEVTFDIASHGYEVHKQVVGGGISKTPTALVLSGPDGQSQYTGYRINIYPIDSDGDGVPNNTPGYPIDACPTVAGIASNNGCQPAAPANPTPASQTPNTGTNNKPSTATKSTSNKTAPASNTTSAPSVVVATTGDTSPPSAPENLIVSQIDEGLFLSWDESTDNIGIKGYKIERSNDNETWEPLAANISDSFYTDPVTENTGQHYYYRVAAVDAVGNTSESVLTDIKLVSNLGKDTESKEKTAMPASKKKSSASLAAGLTLGTVMILAAIAGAFVLVRRHLKNSRSNYYDTDMNSAAYSVPSVVVDPHQPQPSQAGAVPRYNVGPPAQHTAVSLKEMVMENRNQHSQK